MHNADILFKDDATVDDLIDVIEGNRRYVKCLYVYNKIDVCSIEEIDDIARRPNSIPASAGLNMNMDGLLTAIWEKMGLVRVYTKKVVIYRPESIHLLCVQLCIESVYSAVQILALPWTRIDLKLHARARYKLYTALMSISSLYPPCSIFR